MATPAAILGILVKASTAEANLALAKTDAQLSATAASAERTTAATSTAGATMRKMGTAAKWAGAAIAVGFVVEAKKAVETTQDLTKSTISLHKNLGIANKRASEWAAVAKARGVDTTKLGMAFKTLSTQVESARSGSAAAKEEFRSLGISQDELAQGSKNVSGLILQVSDGIDKLGAGTARTNIESKLFGRGWQTIAPLMRDGSAALQQNLNLTKQYGATLQGQTLKAQEDLLASQRESKIAWEGIQIQLANFVTPALMAAEGQFQKIAKILADPRLSDDQQFKKIAGLIEDDISKALAFVEKQIPVVANRVGKEAPKIALALVQGFLSADVWGKLALGAWFFSKAGLTKGLFSARGGSAGKWFALAFIAAWEAQEVVKIISGEMLDATTREQEAATLEKAGYKDIQFRGLHRLTAIDPLGNRQKLIEKNNKWEEKNLPPTQRSVQEAVHRGMDLDKQQQDIWDKMQSQGRQAMDTLDSLLGDKSRETGKKVVHNYGQMAVGTAKNLSSLVGAVTSGLDLLGTNTNKALQAFGVKALTFTLAKPGKVGGTLGGIAGALGFQRGGMIPGVGDGDKVPVWAEPGEGFLNKSLVKAIGGKKGLDALNSMIPRFAQGGMVGGDTAGLVTPFLQALNAMSGSTHTPINVISGRRSRAEQAALYSAYLAGRGNLAAAPGTSHHELGIAADIAPGRERFGGVAGNFGMGFTVPSESWHIELLNAAAGKYGTQVAKVARVILKGPAGALRNLGQGALDKAWHGANSFLAKQRPSVGGSGLGNVSGAWTKVMRNIASERGWSMSDWMWIVQHESGGRVSAQNPKSTAFGLGQLLSSNWPTYGGGPGSSGAQQIAAMAGYIADRYGNPSSARDFWESHGYYKHGGIVEQIHDLSKRTRHFEPTGHHQRKRAAHMAAHLAELETLLGLRRESGQLRSLRSGIGAAQSAVFAGLPFGGSFEHGGVVPGPIGAPRIVEAHGGERITPPGSATVEINFASGMEWLERFIEVKVDGQTRKKARAADRRLPGRPGVLR